MSGLKLKVVPQFPAQVLGGPGIDVVKQNGNYTFGLDYTDFPQISVLPADVCYALIFDPVTNRYLQTPLSLFGGGGSGGIADAPVDGNTYGRQSAAWVKLPPDAPSDGNAYGRLNAAWAKVLTDAPLDGNTYARNSGGWVQLPAQVPTGWSNTRLSKVSAYTVANADKGSTIALGGGAFYQLTFNAASGYDANFLILVLNEDTGRGKTISIPGIGGFMLWPGQSCFVFASGGIWHVFPPLQRWAKSGVQFYVDPNVGNDNNDGLAAGAGNAFQTISRAVQVLYQNVDCQQGAPTINLASGTYTEAVSVFSQLTGFNYVLFQGAGSASTIWRPGANGSCLQVGDNGECQVAGIKFDNAGGAANCLAISVHQDGVIDVLNDVVFGTFPGSTSRHINSDQGGFINMPPTYTIAGAVWSHMNIGTNTVVSQSAGGTIIFSGSFTVAILYRIIGARLMFSGVESYSLGSAAVTSAYYIDFGTMIMLNGTSLPGGAGSGNGTHGAVIA